MPIITTLNFGGHTEEALAFYTAALAAETVFLMRFRDCPDPEYARRGDGNLIFHATFRIEGTEFMASDVGGDESGMRFAGFALALQVKSITRARKIFSALGAGGQVIVPLAQSAFTGWYGIVTDRFGVAWKINVPRPQR